MPERSSTLMCLDTALSDISNGRARSVTRVRPRDRRATMRRRVGSARAAKARSSLDMNLYSTKRLNMSSMEMNYFSREVPRGISFLCEACKGMSFFARGARKIRPDHVRPDSHRILRSTPVRAHPVVVTVVAVDPHGADIRARVVVRVVRRIAVAVELGAIVGSRRIVAAAAGDAGANQGECDET